MQKLVKRPRVFSDCAHSMPRIFANGDLKMNGMMRIARKTEAWTRRIVSDTGPQTKQLPRFGIGDVVLDGSSMVSVSTPIRFSLPRYMRIYNAARAFEDLKRVSGAMIAEFRDGRNERKESICIRQLKELMDEH